MGSWFCKWALNEGLFYFLIGKNNNIEMRLLYENKHEAAKKITMGEISTHELILWRAE